jgi:hypothetical protein
MLAGAAALDAYLGGRGDSVSPIAVHSGQGGWECAFPATFNI